MKFLDEEREKVLVPIRVKENETEPEYNPDVREIPRRWKNY